MRSNRDDDWDDEAPPPPPFADAPPPPPDVLPQGEVYDWYVRGLRPARGRQPRGRGHPADARRQLRAGVPQRPGGAGPGPVRLRDVRRGRAELQLDHLDQPGRRLRAVRPRAWPPRRSATCRPRSSTSRWPPRCAPTSRTTPPRCAAPGRRWPPAGDPATRRRRVRRRPARPRRRGLPRADADRRGGRGARRGPDGRDAAGLRHQQRVAHPGGRRRAAARNGRPGGRGRGDHLLAGGLPRCSPSGCRPARRCWWSAARGCTGPPPTRGFKVVDQRGRRAGGGRAGVRSRRRLARAGRGDGRGAPRRLVGGDQPGPDRPVRARSAARQRRAGRRGPRRDRAGAAGHRQAGPGDAPGVGAAQRARTTRWWWGTGWTPTSRAPAGSAATACSC